MHFERGITDTATGYDSIRVEMRNYLSSHFLWSAIHFTKGAREIEDGPGRRPRFDVAHRALVLASITASVSFLEAMANELFQDAADGHNLSGDGYLSQLAPSAHQGLANAWNAGAGRLGVVPKYRMLVEAAGFAKPDIGRSPYQDASLLIDLKNALIHYHPENVAVDIRHGFDAKLRGRFAANPLLAGNPWWPDLALGSGCAEWACTTAKLLADEVAGVMGIRPNYRRMIELEWAGLGEP